jgi:flagellar biosynthesis activator protein FlaF
MPPPAPAKTIPVTNKNSVLQYSNASRGYNKQTKLTTDTPRLVEARALLKAARYLQALQNDWQRTTNTHLESALRINREIWLAFFEQASARLHEDPEHSLSLHVTSLSRFVLGRSLEILTNPDPEKLNALITINREIAAGLMTAKVQ